MPTLGDQRLGPQRVCYQDSSSSFFGGPPGDRRAEVRKEAELNSQSSRGFGDQFPVSGGWNRMPFSFFKACEAPGLSSEASALSESEANRFI